MEKNFKNARTLSFALEKTGHFDVVSDIHRPKGVYEHHHKHDEVAQDGVEYNPGSPCVAFKLTDKFREQNPGVRQSAVSKMMRMRGWVVPNYALPRGQEHVEAMRIVVRESLSREMLTTLIEDLTWTATLLSGESTNIL